MNALTIINAETPGALTTVEIEAVLDFAANAKSEATRIAYANDFADWTRWCDARGACPMPTSPAHVCAYLSHLALGSKKASTIGRRAAAIAYYSKQAGIDPPPTAHEGVRTVLKGIRRTIGAA